MSKSTSTPASSDALLKLANKAEPYRRTFKRKSKLDPYAEVIKALSAKKYSTTAITKFLKDNDDFEVTPLTIYQWKKRNVAASA